MPEDKTIRFKNYARLVGAPNVFCDIFSDHFSVDGLDIIVPTAAFDRALNTPLARCGPMYEIKGDLRVLADSLVASHADESAWRYQQGIDRRIDTNRLDRRYGILSDQELAITKVSIAQDKGQLAQALAAAFETLGKSHPITHVTPVSLDFNSVQRWLTLSKIAYLLTKHEFESVSDLLWTRNSFGSIELSAMTVLDWVDALTRSVRAHFTMPLHFTGCTWHLICEKGFLNFSDARALDGMSAVMSSALSPLATIESHQGFQEINNVNGDRIWEYLRFVTGRVQHTIRFLVDPRNFLDNDGDVDFLKQLQSCSAFWLLFSDLAAMSFSSSFYNGSSYAFAVLDKLANLRVALGQFEGSKFEGSIMRALASLAQGGKTADRLAKSITKQGYNELGRIWSTATNQVYTELHNDLSNQFIDADVSEAERLERFGYQRDIRHGTFLQKNKFERMFVESDGAISPRVPALPHFLVLDLISDPRSFLDFDPRTASN